MTETSEWPKRADTPQADSVASTAGVPPSPGALHGEAWLILQTRDAHRLALGRRAAPGKPRIIGLPVFGSQASVIYDCARLDDPYADGWLIRIEQSLAAARQVIGELRQAIEPRLRLQAGVEIRLATSTAPVRLPLRFNHPYGGAAALLLADYDRLMLEALTARHYGLIDRAAFGRLRERAGHAIRRLLASAEGYRYCGVTRQDFAAGTVRAQEARKLLGDLPEEVIAGRSRAALAPEILREGALFRPRDPSRKILSRHSQAGAEEGPKENDSGT